MLGPPFQVTGHTPDQITLGNDNLWDILKDVDRIRPDTQASEKGAIQESTEIAFLQVKKDS